MKLAKKLIHSLLVVLMMTSVMSGVSFAATPYALPSDKKEFDDAMYNGEMDVTGNPKITFIKKDSSDITWDTPLSKQDGALFGMKASFELKNIDEIIEGVANGELPSIPEIVRPLVNEFKAYALISGSFELKIDLNSGLGDYFKINQDVLTEIQQDPNKLFDGNKAYKDIFTINTVTEANNVVTISVSMKPNVTGADILHLKDKFKTLDVTFKNLFELNPTLWDKVDQINKGEFDKLVEITAPETIFIVKIPDWVLKLAETVIPGFLKNPFVGVEIHMDPGDGKLNLGYLIIYDGNGNTSGNVPNDTGNPYPEQIPVTVLDKQDLKKDGYSFVGWALQKEEMDPTKIIQPNTPVTLSKNLLLYAQWRKDEDAKPVTVHYQDENGVKMEEDATLSGKIGDKLDIEKKKISGYEFKEFKAAPGVLGADGKVTITDQPQEVTVVYKKSQKEINVTIHYLEDTSGKKIMAPKVLSGKEGEAYDLTSEVIPINGYTISQTRPAENISGTYGNSDIDVNIYYTSDFGLISQDLPENIDFGTHKITKADESLDGSTGASNKVGVTDYRIDRKGWKLSIRQEGFKTTGAENPTTVLDGAQLYFKFGSLENKNGVAPSISKAGEDVLLNPGQAVTIMSAKDTSGTGTNSMNIDKYTLKVPGTTSKVADNYQSAITWTLSDTPD